MGRNKQKEKAPYIDGVLSKLADPKWMKKQGFAVGDTTDINRVRKHVATMGGSNEADNFIDGLRAALNAKLGEALFALSPTQKDKLSKQADATRNTIKASTQTYVDKRAAKEAAIKERQPVLQLLKGAVAQWKMMIEHYEDMKRKRAVALKGANQDELIDYHGAINDKNNILNTLKFTNCDSKLIAYTKAFDEAVKTGDVISASTKASFEEFQGAVKESIALVVTEDQQFTVPIDNEGVIFKTNRDKVTNELTSSIKFIDEKYQIYVKKRVGPSKNVLLQFITTIPSAVTTAVKKTFDYPTDEKENISETITSFLELFAPIQRVDTKGVIDSVDKILDGTATSNDKSIIETMNIMDIAMEPSQKIIDSYKALKTQMTLTLDSQLIKTDAYIAARKKITILRTVYDKIDDAIKKFSDIDEMPWYTSQKKHDKLKETQQNEIKLAAKRIVELARCLAGIEIMTRVMATKSSNAAKAANDAFKPSGGADASTTQNYNAHVTAAKEALVTFTLTAAWGITDGDTDAKKLVMSTLKYVDNVFSFYKDIAVNEYEKARTDYNTKDLALKAATSKATAQSDYDISAQLEAKAKQIIENAKGTKDVAQQRLDDYKSKISSIDEKKDPSKIAVDLIHLYLKLNQNTEIFKTLDDGLEQVVGFKSGLTKLGKVSARTGAVVAKGLTVPYGAAKKGITNLHPTNIRINRSAK